ncbi:hypothetical protein DL89DRAFT_321854 [Linderina pennispora]|uniref:Glutathione S-transferase n=1 Tax=Linderina pennispora TaxID=61395 RepID=A0A1Y1WDG0_9FUNG|nr:uncharacterized protein DL89DRAFT_321854 [Linderina pennispora]ORX71561.1 hypothetical protein DL89DRAFT_321854 [Linderina pennispora]
MASIVSTSYNLRYFNFPGLAETIRLLLCSIGAQWTEEHPEWPEKKGEQPFGHLPVLVEKDSGGQVLFTLSESLVIERYLLRKHSLVPSDPELAARQEQLRDQLYDAMVAMSYAMHAGGESAHIVVRRCTEILENLGQVHGKALRDNGSNGHLFGDKTTYPDLALYAFIRHIRAESAKEESAEIAAHFDSEAAPEFKKLVAVVEADPALQSYFEIQEKIGKS